MPFMTAVCDDRAELFALIVIVEQDVPSEVSEQEGLLKPDTFSTFLDRNELPQPRWPSLAVCAPLVFKSTTSDLPCMV